MNYWREFAYLTWNPGKLKEIIRCAQIIFIKDRSNPLAYKNSISPQCFAVISTVYISFKIQFFTLSAFLYTVADSEL